MFYRLRGGVLFKTLTVLKYLDWKYTCEAELQTKFRITRDARVNKCDPKCDPNVVMLLNCFTK